jgi:hypothetical protein
MIPALVVGFAGVVVHRLGVLTILVIFGTALFVGEHYNLGWWGRALLGIFLALYIWLKVSNWRKRNNAANNVILAKHTFSQLSESDRQRVHNHAVEIINRSGGKFTRFTEETSQYGWYALALAELGIPPAMPGEKDWLYVSNPFIAISPRDPMLKVVSEFYRKRKGVKVEISDQSTLFRPKASC